MISFYPIIFWRHVKNYLPCSLTEKGILKNILDGIKIIIFNILDNSCKVLLWGVQPNISCFPAVVWIAFHCLTSIYWIRIGISAKGTWQVCLGIAQGHCSVGVLSGERWWAKCFLTAFWGTNSCTCRRKILNQQHLGLIKMRHRAVPN